MSDPTGRYTRLRYTAVGALAALAAAGGIAGTVALAAKVGVNAHGQAAVNSPKPAAPTAPGAAKAPASKSGSSAAQPGSSQPFQAAIQRLVADGTITPTEAQAIDSQIQSGSVSTQSLASTGLTQSQLQAVQQALVNTKLALAASA